MKQMLNVLLFSRPILAKNTIRLISGIADTNIQYVVVFAAVLKYISDQKSIYGIFYTPEHCSNLTNLFQKNLNDNHISAYIEANYDYYIPYQSLIVSPYLKRGIIKSHVGIWGDIHFKNDMLPNFKYSDLINNIGWCWGGMGVQHVQLLGSTMQVDN